GSARGAGDPYLSRCFTKHHPALRLCGHGRLSCAYVMGGGRRRLRRAKAGELAHYAFKDRALERHALAWQDMPLLPATAHELGLVAVARVLDVDFAVAAREADRVPLLALATITPFPDAPGDGARDIVGQPLGDFAELFHRAGAGFLVKLAHRRRPGILAVIDAPLRHLPDEIVGGVLDTARTATDENEARGIDQHHADALAVGKVVVTGHIAEMS